LFQKIENCENITQKQISDMTDLIFDVLKYSENSWALVQEVENEIKNNKIVAETGTAQHDQQTKFNDDDDEVEKKEDKNEKPQKNEIQNLNSPPSTYSNPTSGFASNDSSPNSKGFTKPDLLPDTFKNRKKLFKKTNRCLLPMEQLLANYNKKRKVPVDGRDVEGRLKFKKERLEGSPRPRHCVKDSVPSKSVS